MYSFDEWDSATPVKPSDELRRGMQVFRTKLSDFDVWAARIDDDREPLSKSQARRLADVIRCEPEYIRDLHKNYHRANKTPPLPERDRVHPMIGERNFANLKDSQKLSTEARRFPSGDPSVPPTRKPRKKKPAA
jgi:hypothetical protein